jgi:hypothetical protein
MDPSSMMSAGSPSLSLSLCLSLPALLQIQRCHYMLSFHLCSFGGRGGGREIHDRKQSMGEGAYFQSQSQLIIHHWEEIKAGTSKAWSHRILSQEQREMNICMLLALAQPPSSILIHYMTPSSLPWEWCHPQWTGSSSLINELS